MSTIALLVVLSCKADPPSDSAEPVGEHEESGDTGTEEKESRSDSGDSVDTGEIPLDETGDTASPDVTYPLLPPVPLSTSGRWILDSGGARFKLASANWYGFEELDYVPAGLEIAAIDDIAETIAALGFNSVRLPFSLEMVEQNAVVDPLVVAANPALEGFRALEVMDAVIDALGRAGLVVILDNHSSEAVWYSLENGLWYTEDYPESVWLSVWRDLAYRYVDHPAVVGFDLRNELRNGATWGGPPETDWKAAASRAADEILAIDPTKLIVVEGIGYSSDFSGVYTDPLELSVAGRLVYSPHDYSWFHGEIANYNDLAVELGSWWGFLIVEGQPYTAPVWVGEFGTCNTGTDCVDMSTRYGAWFANFVDYLAAGDIDWAYWPVNGTMARAIDREYGAVDWYGVLDETWLSSSLPELLERLQGIQEPWAFPE